MSSDLGHHNDDINHHNDDDDDVIECTLQDKEALATVEVLQHPSPDKPLVNEFYFEFNEMSNNILF